MGSLHRLEIQTDGHRFIGRTQILRGSDERFCWICSTSSNSPQWVSDAMSVSLFNPFASGAADVRRHQLFKIDHRFKMSVVVLNGIIWASLKTNAAYVFFAGKVRMIQNLNIFYFCMFFRFNFTIHFCVQFKTIYSSDVALGPWPRDQIFFSLASRFQSWPWGSWP